MNLRLLAALSFALALSFTAVRAAPPPVQSARVTVLSTMLAGDPLFKGIGEWGFSALVEADGYRLLFDTGLRPQTVLHNASELGLDLSGITDVVLSHNHADHIGGLLTLRREFAKKNPKALSRVHVGRGIFWSRGPGDDGKEENAAIALKAAYEATGGVFIEHDKPEELAPGVWLTGPIARTHPEKNYGTAGKVLTATGWTEDTIPEDIALVLDTTRGLVVLTGCGHAGAINTLAHARRTIRDTPIDAAIGGLHLLTGNDETLAWTSTQLRTLEVRRLLAAHCTGLEATYRLRERGGFTRATATVAAVGASYDSAKGLNSLVLAR
ncbi:MAG: MBL fold metallo-hydrolase [Undibacterium sp.]|nr:MBL fold metallo-hydrolase [Opitutaceae bacterium]